jgi:hypothetical protein
MKNFRSLDAHTFFNAGWVQTVMYMKLASGNFFMRASVKPSYRVTEEPHEPWIAVQPTGSIITAHCNCKAG